MAVAAGVPEAVQQLMKAAGSSTVPKISSSSKAHAKGRSNDSPGKQPSGSKQGVYNNTSSERSRRRPATAAGEPTIRHTLKHDRLMLVIRTADRIDKLLPPFVISICNGETFD